jgi:CSLREA domain-containing protein
MNRKISLLVVFGGILLALGVASLNGFSAKAWQGGWARAASLTGLAPVIAIKANPAPLTASPAVCPSSFTVNSLDDAPDAAAGDMACADAGGQCTLRAAIMEANALFSCPAITINITPTGVINLGSALPNIAHDLTIHGPTAAPGVNVKRNSNDNYTVLVILPNQTVTINNLTISNGSNTVGGGIANIGDLTLTNVTLVDNVATGGGGGLENRGAAMLTNCTISGNSAQFGGGILAEFNAGSGPFTTTLINCTVTNNTASNQGGGIYLSNLVSLTLGNTIVADNTAVIGPDVRNLGTLTSSGHNLIGNSAGSSGFGASDLLNVNARLAPLGDYGGPTQTHALTWGSPAIDAGDNALDPATDQRGLPRSQDGDGNNTNIADIGAFEVQKYVVTTEADTGAGSLRQAITDNNAAGGGLIAFNIPGAGVHTITPPAYPSVSLLPAISRLVILDGYTQPGASPNTLAVGSNATLLINIDGVTTLPNGQSVGVTNGLVFNSGYNCVRGLSITRFAASLNLSGANAVHNWIQGNYIGVSPAGASDDHGTGIQVIAGASNNLIGTDADGVNDPAERNLISGKLLGIRIGGSSTGGNQVAGNYLGTDAAGTTLVENVKGIEILGGSSNNTIGGTRPGEGNLIFFTEEAAVAMRDAGTVNNRILGNRITWQLGERFLRRAPGIDLREDLSQTPNDAGDADTGPNNLQNFPVLNSVTSTGLVSGSLDSLAANTAYPVRIEFFASADIAGQGDLFLGFINVAGPGNFTAQVTPSPGKPFITATATDNNGNTSEFSNYRRGNSPPSTTGANHSMQPGSAANVVIAYIRDSGLDQTADTLSVTVTPLTGTGVMVSNITAVADSFNTYEGYAYADVAVACSATTSTFAVTVTDNVGETATSTLTVNVTANPAPALVYPATTSVASGGTTTIAATTASDNGSITGFSIVGVTPAMTTAPTVDSSGVVLITNAAQPGNHTITVRAADNCGATTDASFTLNIGCQIITVTPPATNTVIAGAAFSQTFTQTGGIGTTTFSTASVLPTGLILSGSGALSGTPMQSGTFPITVKVTDANGCMGTVNYTLTINCPAISITPTNLPNGMAGMTYQMTTLAASGGTAAYSFSLMSGALPNGLTLSPMGVIAGTPTAFGNFSPVIKATDAYGCSGAQSYTLTINPPCTTITVNPATLPNGIAGTVYSQTLGGSGGGGPYTFAVSGGVLPAWLNLNASTGELSGMPTQTGSFSFSVTATASNGCTGSRDYTLAVACAPVTLTATLPAGTAGTSYAQTITASPTAPAGSYTFAIVQGNLPSGLTLNTQTGAISGLPSITGTYNFTVRAQSASDCSGQQAYSLAINCPTVTLNPASLPSGNTSAAYSQTLSASPAGGNYIYAVTGSVLPAGLMLTQATGTISGTPTQSGNFNFTITATGFGGCAGSKAYSITIGNGCPTITLPDLPTGSIGQPYSTSVTALPSGNYSYAMTSGSLPSGLTLYGTIGLIYGYPAQNGSFTFTITATDSNQCVGSKSYTLAIGGGAAKRAVAGDYDGDGKTDFSLWRAEQSQWLILNSGTPDSSKNALQRVTWARSETPHKDLTVPGDYDGDGKIDVAVFRASAPDGAHWLIKRSSDGQPMDTLWGLRSDTPVPADYDGDGKTDIAVWRGAESNWYVLRSSDNQVQIVSWGTSNAPYRDLPVPADYDGDGKDDIAVFRQANGHWYIKLSSDGLVIEKAWGLGMDVPVVGDYDGDGKADIAVWRGADTNWYILLSGRGSDSQTQIVSWGASWLGDVPVPGDYDGDGKTDIGIWRESDGAWYIKCSLGPSIATKGPALPGDKPVTASHRP